ncbi:MAG: energy transducer TonB [Bacteroidia bacterium]|nr:energy transducer TonB [Bacteroidia bacterium]
MKKLFTLILLLVFALGYSQSTTGYYEWLVRGEIKKEKLSAAKEMTDIIPNYPKNYFGNIVNYVSVEISGTCNGTSFTSIATNEILTTEQKTILSTADFGTDLTLKIKFSYKDSSNDVYGTGGRIKELTPLAITVMPDTEAQYPGGDNSVINYLKETVMKQSTDTSAVKKMMNAIVNFTIDEEGKIIDAKILRSSSDSKIDELLLQATNNMQKWIPAQNANGIKVKQTFSFPTRRNAGC